MSGATDHGAEHAVIGLVGQEGGVAVAVHGMSATRVKAEDFVVRSAVHRQPWAILRASPRPEMLIDSPRDTKRVVRIGPAP